MVAALRAVGGYARYQPVIRRRHRATTEEGETESPGADGNGEEVCLQPFSLAARPPRERSQRRRVVHSFDLHRFLSTEPVFSPETATTIATGSASKKAAPPSQSTSRPPKRSKGLGNFLTALLQEDSDVSFEVKPA